MGPRVGLDTVVVKRKIPSPRRESNPDHPILEHNLWLTVRALF